MLDLSSTARRVICVVLNFLLFTITSRTVITTIRTMITNSSNTNEETAGAILLLSPDDVLKDPEGKKFSHQLYII